MDADNACATDCWLLIEEMKQVFIMAHDTARRNACEAVKNAPEGHVVTIGEPTRTLEQNAAQWPILEAFSEQLQWPVNGRMSAALPRSRAWNGKGGCSD